MPTMYLGAARIQSAFIGALPVPASFLGFGGVPEVTIGQTSASGHLIRMPLPAGFSDQQQTYVAPDQVIVDIDVPSKASNGADTTVRLRRRAGLRANVNAAAGELEVWMAQRIPADATRVELSLSAGAIRNSGQFHAVTAGVITNNSNWQDVVTGHLLGLVEGEDVIRPEYDVIANPFHIEAWAAHESGLAVVEFEISDGTTTQTFFADAQTRSGYRDRAIITPAQWAANGNGGIGVYSSPQIDPADFADGALTIILRAYAKAGGAQNARVMSWTVFANAGGSYAERVRYVDSVAGSDSNDGLTAATAFATMEKGCLEAGAAAEGAGSTDIPVVRLIGSGDAQNPRVYEMYDGSGTGAAVPVAADTYLTIEPAPGHDDTDTLIANHTGGATGRSPRIRRLRFRGLGWDIADAAGAAGTSCNGLVSLNTSVIPASEAAIAFEDVRSFHHLGKAGQIFEDNGGRWIGTNYNGAKCYSYRVSCTDMGRRGLSIPAYNMSRDIIIEDVEKDALKEPDCLIGFKLARNAVDNEKLPIANVVGTPQVGDTMSGVYSTGTETVAAVFGSGANLVLRLTSGGDSYTFKPDDALTHVAIEVNDASGYQIGELVNGQELYRIDGNTLRFRSASGFSVGNFATGETSAASSSVQAISTGETNLFFDPSGARATALPDHPDGLQVQTFVNQRLEISAASGAFQVGETVTAPRDGGGTDISGVVREAGADYLITAGTNQWDLAVFGGQITGGTSGATATFDSRAFADNDGNKMLYCGIMEGIDGAILFAENGFDGHYFGNLICTHFESHYAGDGGLSSMNIGNVGSVLMEHCTLADQNGRIAGSDGDIGERGEMGHAYRACVWVYLTSSTLPQAASTNSVDVAGPVTDILGCHQILGPDRLYYRQTSFGDPLWRDMPDLGTPYDPLLTYEPAPADNSPLFRKVSAGQRSLRFDIFGHERPNDGTAAAGAVEQWTGAARATPPAQPASEPDQMPPVAPDAFASAEWVLSASGISEQIIIDVVAFPSGNDGGDVEDVEVSFDGEATWQSLSGDDLADNHVFDGFTDGVAVTVHIRAVNSAGPGPSAFKAVTPYEATPVISAPVTVFDLATTSDQVLYETATASPSGDPLLVAVMEMAGTTSGSTSDVTQITIGAAGRTEGTGTALIAVGSQKLNRAAVTVYRLPAPATGNQTLQVSLSNPPRGVRIIGQEFAGASGDVGAVGEQDLNNGTTTTMRVSVATTTAQSLVAYYGAQAGGDTVNTVVGATETLNAKTGGTSAGGDASVFAAFEQAPGAAVYEMTYTADAAKQMRGVAVELLASV